MNVRSLQATTDKAAIGLSMLCAVHCLALPVLLVMVPSLSALGLGNEAFHLWMIVAVLPSSLYALTLGCKRHKNYFVAALGICGCTILVGAFVFAEAFLGEFLEKFFTLIGSSCIAAGHYWNYRLCAHHDHCDCSG